MKSNGFECVRCSANVLIVFEDSCKEIYNDKELVRLVTVFRHRGIYVIYVKHNLFQQIRWSRTIGLNTSHIILFKLIGNVQQIDLLERQLNVSKFLRSCYELASRDSFGHLQIDLDPRTSNCLRYCSNITRPGPKVFYVPLSKAETTLRSQMRKKNVSILRHMIQLKPDQLRRLIRKTSNREIITLICDCFLKVVNGNVPVKIENIERFEKASI